MADIAAQEEELKEFKLQVRLVWVAILTRLSSRH
jgi:hypothetical protein